MHIDVFCIDAFFAHSSMKIDADFAHSCMEIDADFAHSSTRNWTSGSILGQKMREFGIFKYTNVIRGSKTNIYQFSSEYSSVPLMCLLIKFTKNEISNYIIESE